jgi:homoserine kinase|tara:strand:+ start:447 stop:1376 length:930 start_codon:yes stop_codon:yes gene_type:complete
MKNIKAFAPATIANFNVGYDILGLSLNNIGDEVELTFNGTKENKISKIINGDNLPYEIDKNCCSVVIRKMQEDQNNFRGVDIILTKGFAAGSGLGSSSASSAAAAYGYNKLIGSPYSNKELVAFAAEGERVACGSPHIDNVAPSILGGLILAKGNNPSDILELPIINNLYAVTLYPNIKVNTSDSRKILKDNVPLATFSKQVAFMGSFVMSLYEKDINLFSDSLQDLVIEPIRSLLIPKFQEMKSEALKNNALAFGVSGSGPSIFAIAEGAENAKKIEIALKKVYKNVDISSQTFISALTKDSGTRILN